MENSMGTTMMSKVSYNNNKECSNNIREESGWTMYLQDFSPKNNVVHDYNNSEKEEDYDYDYSSLSCATVSLISDAVSSKRKINNKRVFIDDDLEDTASSPLASLKEKGNSSRKRNFDGVGFLGRERDCTELKKKGLCLVPLSLVSNYFRS